MTELKVTQYLCASVSCVKGERIVINSGGLDKASANTEHTGHYMLPSYVFLRATASLSSRKYAELGAKRCCSSMWGCALFSTRLRT